MNRTQKKCVVGATGFHLLLLVILFAGPAFLSSHDPADDLPVIEIIPDMTTDKAFFGGGAQTAPPPVNPAPVPAPPVQQRPPVAQQPVAQPKPVVTIPPPKPVQKETEPAKEVRMAKVDPASLEPKGDAKTRKVEVSTKLVTRSEVLKSNQKTTPRNDSAKAADDARQYSTAAQRIREQASTATDVPAGFGGGGVSYANYKQLVRSKYVNAWIEPDGVTQQNAAATVSVTIARDGTVISARLTQSSGNAAVDRAMQSMLERVKFIAPFPQGATEAERSYSLNFNLEANQLLR